MLSLKQAVRIDNDRLRSHISHFVLAPVPRTPALWKHTTNPITLSLVVDNFGVRYVGKENSNYLIQSLQKLYITIGIQARASLMYS